jgi:hypothetical protein
MRAQLFLRWIKQTFPEMPILLLLRHPCAVAKSRLQSCWGAHLDAFLAQQDLIESLLTGLRSGPGSTDPGARYQVRAAAADRGSAAGGSTG